MSGAASLAAPRIRRRPSALATTALILGCVLLAGLWLGPLVPMSRTAFSPHMLLHLGVVVLASPLIAFGLAPHLPKPASLRDAFSWCFLAATFELVAVWGWHIPLLHDAQGHNFALFVLDSMSRG